MASWEYQTVPLRKFGGAVPEQMTPEELTETLNKWGAMGFAVVGVANVGNQTLVLMGKQT